MNETMNDADAHPLDLSLLQALRLKGRLSEEGAIRLLGGDAWSRVQTLAAEGLVAIAPVGARLTPSGRERLTGLIQAERSRIGLYALNTLYEDEFDDLNHALKDVVTAWQMKPSGVANDHSDEAYDAGVIAKLASVHEEAVESLEALGGLVPRLAPYLQRLGNALAQAQAGDSHYVTHPLKDSYHQVWFELHEELLALLGLNRVDEARAGRA